MSRKILIWLAAGGLCLAVVLVTLVGIQAAPGSAADGFTIPWWTVDAGGGTSQGGEYSLSGTIGQPDAGKLSGGGYSLEGGFWSSSAEYFSYLPLITR